jgi:DNA-binding NtrC family response regulator
VPARGGGDPSGVPKRKSVSSETAPPLRALTRTAHHRKSEDGPTPPLRALHQAAARWIGALIRMTSPHPAMTAALDVVARLQERPYRTNFVLLGEPGTGKEGLARALHQLVCADGPLVRFDVAGFSDADALAALAGDGRRGGAAEAAQGGTLLIEETAGLGPRTQAALIRLLKTGRFDGQADAAGKPPRVCAIAMSDHDLWAEVRAGRFRHDLYWRLARIVLKLPPLRERKQDIVPAAIWMGNRILRDAGLPFELVTSDDLERTPAADRENLIELKRDAVAALSEPEWVGNLRELEAVLERALLLYREGGSPGGGSPGGGSPGGGSIDGKAVRAAR